MRILVTGGAGFIGRHVVDALRVAGHEVTSLDALHPAAHRDRRMPDGGLLGDVRDAAVVSAALRDCDLVVHHAAMVGMGVSLDDLPEYVSCNDLGTAVLLAAMARTGVPRLVLASSMVVYGEGAYKCPDHGQVAVGTRRPADLAAGRFDAACPVCGQTVSADLVGEDSMLAPRSVYAATKVAQEHLAAAWARASGSSAIALRYHNVYGPGMPRDTPYAGVAAIFRSTLEQGGRPRVFEDGRQLRDFVHVADVAAANVAAVGELATADRQTGYLRPYNIASGEPHTIGEMAAALAGAFGGPRPTVTGESRAGDVRHIVASPERARSELGFKAEVPFAAGMAEFAHAPLRT
jgi:dTDP-L-rhamnose 4-epimerase